MMRIPKEITNKTLSDVIQCLINQVQSIISKTNITCSYLVG